MSKYRAALAGQGAVLGLIVTLGCSTPADDNGKIMNGALGGQGGSGLPAPAGTSAAGAPGAGTGVMGGAGIMSAAGIGATAGLGGSGIGGSAGAGAGGASGGVGGASGGGAGMAGLGGSGGAAGAAGTGTPEHMDLGMGDGQDVITIGDSWMNFFFGGIEQSLERISMRNYRNYALAGTLVLNEQIPGQYASAKAANPNIKTIVMTGGGNDILFDTCVDAGCNMLVDEVTARLNRLMAEAGTDGVEDIVLIGYTYPDDQSKHASLDYSIMVSTNTCRIDMKPRCHFLDGSKLDLTLQDGIHPNAAGYDLLGKTVWELMQARGMRR